jgi:Mn-dependent DtxR family transcriptional regulator
MGIKLLLNDYYDLLKLMHDNEAIILDEKVIPLTQQQIAATLNYSKMKVNSMFGVLQKEGFVEQKTRGKYVLTDIAESIIKTIEKLSD